MKDHYQLVVIGAGPAGLSAATTAANGGLEVALFDEQPAPGGQIYRAIEASEEDHRQRLGDEYRRGAELVGAFRSSGCAYFADTRVWSLSPQREIGLTHRGRARFVSADRVLVAVGAIERPVPFPGWTLPGVMHAGAAQILFKAHRIVPGDGVVLAGSGPLLLLLGWQLMRAGVEIRALLDVAPLSNWLHALPQLPRALLARHYISKGLAYKKDLKLAGVKTVHNITDLRALGQERLQAVGFRKDGETRRLDTDLLLTHFGVIPNTALTRCAGCDQEWHRSQRCWRPRRDQWGNTSVEGILVAGDDAAIGGARTAEHAGRLAGWATLHALRRIDRRQRDRLSRDDRRWMRGEQHIRPFLEGMFRIPDRILQVPEDATLVCRCEEISAGHIRRAVAAGHRDSNQVKFITRCGMGACQGSQCAAAVAHVVAAATGQGMAEVGQYRQRPPVRPLSLGELASLFPGEQE